MQNGLSWYIMIHQGGKRLVYGRNKKQRKSGRAGLRRGLCRLFIGRLGGNDALVLSSGIYGEGLCSGHAPQIRAGPRRKLLFFLRAAGGSAGAQIFRRIFKKSVFSWFRGRAPGARLIEAVYAERASRIQRYAIKKEPWIFDREKLNNYAESIPEGYRAGAN